MSAYLEHRELAEVETHPERFFLNLILVRVLFAHALVAAPRLALSWLWPLGPVLGDPRLMVTGIFVALSRVMPDRYPLTRELAWYVDNEHGFGRLLDRGLIQPRLGPLYAWSAAELSIPTSAPWSTTACPPTPGTPPTWSRGTPSPAGWARRRGRSCPAGSPEAEASSSARTSCLTRATRARRPGRGPASTPYAMHCGTRYAATVTPASRSQRSHDRW